MISGQKQNNIEGLSIIIPAYNDRCSIAKVLKEILLAMNNSNIDYEIIVVDDGSTDRTAEIVREKGIELVQHSSNRGYGAALKTGIRHAKHDRVAITDADGTYPNEEIPKLASYIGEYDMVVGARIGENVNVPLIRKPVKWILNKLANYIARTKIPDLNSGLRVMRKEIVMDFFRMLPAGFSFTTTITLAMITNDYNVKFIPINYKKRIGKSKIKPIKDTLSFFALVIRIALYFNPLIFFGPISLFFAILSIIKLIYDFFSYPIFHFTASTIMLLMTTFQTLILNLLADLIVSQKKQSKK